MVTGEPLSSASKPQPLGDHVTIVRSSEDVGELHLRVRLPQRRPVPRRERDRPFEPGAAASRSPHATWARPAKWAAKPITTVPSPTVIVRSPRSSSRAAHHVPIAASSRRAPASAASATNGQNASSTGTSGASSINGSPSPSGSQRARTASQTPGPRSLARRRTRSASKPSSSLSNSNSSCWTAAAISALNVRYRLPSRTVASMSCGTMSSSPRARAFVVLHSDTRTAPNGKSGSRQPAPAPGAARRPRSGCQGCTRRAATPGSPPPSPSRRRRCGRRRRTSSPSRAQPRHPLLGPRRRGSEPRARRLRCAGTPWIHEPSGPLEEAFGRR